MGCIYRLEDNLSIVCNPRVHPGNLLASGYGLTPVALHGVWTQAVARQVLSCLDAAREDLAQGSWLSAPARECRVATVCTLGEAQCGTCICTGESNASESTSSYTSLVQPFSFAVAFPVQPPTPRPWNGSLHPHQTLATSTLPRRSQRFLRKGHRDDELGGGIWLGT